MAFPSWFTRFSSKHIFRSLRTTTTSFTQNYSYISRTPSTSSSSTSTIEKIISTEGNKQYFSWSSSLLPLALTFSAGLFSLERNVSVCDSDVTDGVGLGGKGSTEHVVEGYPKEIPQELIKELEAICKDNMTRDYEERHFHGKPQNNFHKAVNIPDIVVFP
ncbi:hypothetical protein MKW94_030568, partial [Papaver nudicaule]|nr:hypothetical protein [Papaver nudicaule]